MSSAPTPSTPGSPAPQRSTPKPEIVRHAPPQPRRNGFWLILAVVILAAAGLYWKTQSAKPTAQKTVAVTRTAGIVVGDLHRTIRISGTVQAEKFASIMAPQIRGSRSDRGRSFGRGGSMGGGGSSSGGSSGGSGSTDTAPAQPSAGTASSSSSSSGTSPSGDSSGSSGTPEASAAGAAATPRSSIGATRGTTNRFSDMSGSTGKGNTSASARGSSGSLTSSNLGSTGTNLITPGGGPPGGGGGMGGGGGSSDFMMVLVKCVPGGTHVKKGDVVGEFDRQYQLNRLDDYKATLVQYEANLRKMKADQGVAREAHERLIEAAKADWDKAKLDLQTIPVRSSIEAEDFKLAEQQAAAHYKQVLAERKEFDVSQKADLRRAELDRDKSKIELQRAEANVNLMVMKAPIDGIAVMQTIVRGGETNQVRQGDQVYSGMAFMTIVDPASMVLNATVNQVDSETLRVGMKATVHLDAYPDLSLASTVVAVGAMTDAGGWRATWVRQVPVRLKLNQIDPRVIPDLSASADIVLDTERQVAVAPLESIFRDSPDGRPYVYVQAATGFEKREVEVGLTSYTAAAIRSGVRQGDVVALNRPYLAQAVKAGAS